MFCRHRMPDAVILSLMFGLLTQITPAEAAGPRPLSKPGQDVTIADVFDFYTRDASLRKRVNEKKLLRKGHSDSTLGRSRIAYQMFAKASSSIEMYDGHQHPMALEAMYMKSTAEFDAKEYRNIFFHRVAHGQLSGEGIDFINFKTAQYNRDFNGPRKPLRGDIVRLTRTVNGEKKHLYLVVMEKGRFPDRKGSTKKEWFFAYPFKNQIEYNTMPPRFNARLVGYFLGLRKQKKQDSLPKRAYLTPRSSAGKQHASIQWLSLALPPKALRRYTWNKRFVKIPLG